MNRFSLLSGNVPPYRSDSSSTSVGLSESGGGTVSGTSSSTTPTTSLLEKRLTSSDTERRTLYNTSRPGTSMMNGPMASIPSSSSGASLSSMSDTPPIPWSPSSAKAHRGPYTKPAFLDQRPMATRFSPYTRKPIFVGARKVTDEDSMEPNLTSTAQRMIEILKRNTTPVVEGLRKVPIHATTIKTVKPILSSAKGGPPTTRSPFALDGTSTPLPLPVLPSYLLPKNVPSPVTSTSKPVQQLPPPLVKTSPFSQIQFGKPPGQLEFNYDGETKSAGGGKLKGKTTRVHDSIVRPTQTQTQVIPRELKPNVADPPVSVPTTHIAHPKSPLPNPAVDANFSFSSAWSMKSKEKSLPNGLPEEIGFYKELFRVIKNHPINDGVVKPLSVGSTLSSMPPTAQASTWPCPTCLIHNKINDSQCVCCTEPRPSQYGSSPKVEKINEVLPSTWSCPTCMVDNKIGESACVCCTEPRPAKYTNMLGASGGSSGQEPKKNAPADASKFKFGFSASNVAGPPTANTGFSFGAPKPSADFSSNFKFGTSTTASDSVPSTFTFGSNSKSTSNSTSTESSFKFGVANSAGDSTAFKFGISTASPTVPATGGTASSGFKFVSPSSTVSSSATSVSSDQLAPSNPPFSANAFRKGFGLTSGTPEQVSSLNTTKFSENEKKPLANVKFSNFPSSNAEDKDSDAEIEKYKFPLFSGGPKPAFSAQAFSSTPRDPKLSPISSPIVAPTTTVSSAQAPISFGGFPNVSTATAAPTPTPITNGIDLFKKPTTSATTVVPNFSFGLPTTKAPTSSVKETVSISAPSSGFTFGVANTTSKPATTTSAVTSASTFSFGSSAVTVTPSTTGTTTPTFSFGGTTPSTVPSNTAPSQPSFTFGTGEAHKRKAPASDGNGFQFNSMEPKIKIRSDALGGAGDAPVIKTGSFLDAMKQPGFGIAQDKPDGQIQTIPSNNVFGNSSRGGGFSNPNAGFQFTGLSTAPPQTAPAPSGFNFGTTPTTTSLTNNTNVFSNFGSSQPSATPQFTPNLVPNFDFGQSPGTASTTPILFSAGASPASQPSDGRRKAKAVRRLR